MYQRFKVSDEVKQKVMNEDTSVRRVLSPLPPITPNNIAPGKSLEWKRSNDSEDSLPKAMVESEGAPEPLSNDTDDSSSDGTDKQENEPQANIMFEIGRKVIRLYLCENHSCKTCLFDFAFINWANHVGPNRKKVTQKLLEIGFIELVQQTLTLFLNQSFTKADSDSLVACLSAIYLACATVTNMTDISEEACRKVIQLELHTDIINFLKSDHPDPRVSIYNLISILYNVVQKSTEARELYREQGIIEIIQRFRTGEANSLSCLALMFLAWVINDDENSILNSSNDAFSFLNEELKSTLDKSYYGCSSVEFLAAINKLIVNDANKELFINIGILSSYVMFLEPDIDAEKQYLAVQGIWTLAFKYAEEIKMEKTCVERLELLLKKSEHDEVRSQINGVLITLGIKQESPIRTSKLSPKEGSSSDPEEKGRRIFISYQRSWSETVVKIRDRLRDHGYIVWMDVDNICDAVADDIANGIDTSSIVLVCLSQKYHESPYCKKEVNYATENKKEIIPLTLEPKYKPHGWLGLLVADKYRIDYSQPQSFDESLRILLQRLKKSFDETDNGRPNNQSSSSHLPAVHWGDEYGGGGITSEPKVVQRETYSMSHSASTTADVYSWTKTDVKEWFEKNNFQHLTKWFDDYDGQLLFEFHCVLEKSPEMVSPSFLAAHSVKDLLRLKIALRSLP